MYLFAKAEPRPGHEGEVDYPCCTSASLDCSCGGAGVWIPCECDECVALLDRQEEKLRGEFLAAHGAELLEHIAEMMWRAQPANHREDSAVVCNYCYGRGIYTADWIEHKKDCPAAKIKWLLGHTVMFENKPSQ